MRRVALLLIAVGFGSRAHAEEMKMSADESAILTIHQDFGRVWSKGSVDELIAFFAPDALRVGAAGDVARGPTELKAAFTKLLVGPFKGAKIEIERGTVRMLSADAAIWQAPM